MKGVYTTVSNHTCEQAAELRNSQVQLDALNVLLKTTTAERKGLEQDLATKLAELSALQDRLSSANASARNQLDTLKQSFNTVQAERQKLSKTLSTRTTELSLLQDQLSSTNASNANATRLLNMLRAEIVALKLQNSRLKSEISHPVFRRPDAVFKQPVYLLKKSQPLIECGICMEKYPEDQMIPLEPCGHKLCRNCVKNYVGIQLAERSFPVLCPVCKAEGRKEDPGSA
jgi:hypothetical protein